MTVVEQSESSGRIVNLMDTLSTYDDREQDLVWSSMSVPSPAYGLHQVAFRHHNIQDGAPTSSRGLGSYLANVQLCKDASRDRRNEAAVEGFKKEMKDLEDLLSKLNPMAEEFVPSSLAGYGNGSGWRHSNAVGFQNANAEANAGHSNRKRSSFCQEKRRMNSRTNLAQRGEVIRRTVYVSDIDHQVTEEQLATLFINCGQVVDCRICGDPNSILRFAFIEFTDEDGARAALGLSGTMLGYYPVRVLPSKTAIAPVNPTFLPRSEDEREMCGRTVYCTNIDKKADSATAALNCSGATLGSQPIRVSPSKTPVRPRPPRYSALRM